METGEKSNRTAGKKTISERVPASVKREYDNAVTRLSKKLDMPKTDVVALAVDRYVRGNTSVVVNARSVQTKEIQLVSLRLSPFTIQQVSKIMARRRGGFFESIVIALRFFEEQDDVVQFLSESL